MLAVQTLPMILSLCVCKVCIAGQTCCMYIHAGGLTDACSSINIPASSMLCLSLILYASTGSVAPLSGAPWLPSRGFNGAVSAASFAFTFAGYIYRAVCAPDAFGQRVRPSIKFRSALHWMIDIGIRAQAYCRGCFGVHA
jgi:hypothetical protein